MTHQEIQKCLDDFAADMLSEPEREGVGQHLQQCETCRREAEFFRRLLATAASLTRRIAPERDLWPGIEARTQARADTGVAGDVNPLEAGCGSVEREDRVQRLSATLAGLATVVGNLSEDVRELSQAVKSLRQELQSSRSGVLPDADPPGGALRVLRANP